MAEQNIRGRFVWHELTTPDSGGAHAFYAKALGWKTQPFEHDPSYSMFVGPNGPLGGASAAPSATPRWLPYIAAPDITATVQEAARLGARIVKDVTTITGGGQYAELRDPQGAVFGVYASSGPHSPESPPKRGEFSWNELATSDLRAAQDFYTALFGWEIMVEHDMGEMGPYVIFGSNGVQRGGMYAKPPEMHGDSTWLGYVRVKDLHQTIGKIKAARGTLINEPMEVPGGDWIAHFLDPYGCMFAIHSVAADVRGSGQPKAAAASAAAKSEAPAETARKPAAKPARKAARKSKAKAKGGAKAGAKVTAKARKPAQSKAPRKAGKTAKRKVAAKGKRAAAKGAKRPARKVAKAVRKGARKKVSRTKKRSGGKKKMAQKPRKGK